MDTQNQTPTPSGQPEPNQPVTGPTPSMDTIGAPQTNQPNSLPTNQPASFTPDVSPQPTQSGPTLQPSLPPQPMTTSQPEEPQAKTGSAIASIAGGFSTVLGAIFSWVIFPVAVVLILHNFVFQAYHVLGTSMVPTLHDTDYLIVSKLGYTEALIGRAFGQDDKYLPGRGEVIVFRYPKDPTKVFVKRVVGLPGDRIVVKNGTVTIYNKANPNGFNPDAKYEPKDATTLIDTDETVQPGNLFVMGDNRTPGGSYDSREWGELPSSYIIGNAVLRLLPLDQVRTF